MEDFSEDIYDDDGASVCTEDLEMELQVLEDERQALSKIEQLKRLIAAGRRSSSTFAKQAQALKNKCVRQQLALDNASNADKSFSTHRVSQLKDRLSSRTAMMRERRRQRTARRLKCVHQAAKSALQIDLLSIANGEWDELRVFPPTSLESVSAARLPTQMAPRLTRSLSDRVGVGTAATTSTAFHNEPTQWSSQGRDAAAEMRFRTAIQKNHSTHHDTNSRNLPTDDWDGPSSLRPSAALSSPPRSSTPSTRSPPVSPGNVSAEIAQLIAEEEEDEGSNDSAPAPAPAAAAAAAAVTAAAAAGVEVLSLHDVDNLKGELSESDDEMAELEAESKPPTATATPRSVENASSSHHHIPSTSSSSTQSISKRGGKLPGRASSSPKTEAEIRFEKAKAAALERQRAAEQRLSEAESAAAERQAQREKLAEERRLAQEEIKRTNELSQRLQRDNLAEARRLAQEEIDRTNDTSQRMNARVDRDTPTTRVNSMTNTEAERLPEQKLSQSRNNWNEQVASLHVATDADFGLDGTVDKHKHKIHGDHRDHTVTGSTSSGNLRSQVKSNGQPLPPYGRVSSPENVVPASALPAQSGEKLENSESNTTTGDDGLSPQQHDSSIELFIGAPPSTQSKLVAGKVSYGDYSKTTTKRVANGAAGTSETITAGKEEWGYNDEGDYVKLVVPQGSSFERELSNQAHTDFSNPNFAAKSAPSTTVTMNSKATTERMTFGKPDKNDSVMTKGALSSVVQPGAAAAAAAAAAQAASFQPPPGPSGSAFVQPPPPSQSSWSLNAPVSSENNFETPPGVGDAVAPPPPPPALDETVMPGFAAEGRPPAGGGRRDKHGGSGQRMHGGTLDDRSAHPPPHSTSLNPAVGPPPSNSSSSEVGNFGIDFGGNGSKPSRRGRTSARNSLETTDLFGSTTTTNPHASPPASSPRKPSRRVSRRSSAGSVADSGVLSDDSDFSSLASSPRAGHSAAPPQPQRFNFGQARTATTQNTGMYGNSGTDLETALSPPRSALNQATTVGTTSLQTSVQRASPRLNRKFSLRGMEDDGFDTDSTFNSTPGASPTARAIGTLGARFHRREASFGSGMPHAGTFQRVDAAEETSGSFDF